MPAFRLKAIKSPPEFGQWPFLFKILSLALPLAFFIAALHTPWPHKVLAYSYSVLWVFVLPAAALLTIGYWRNDWLSNLAGLTITLILFALPLLALWQQAGNHDNAIGGLLPAADARGYYHDARRLLNGELFGWAGRRPLFTGMLATILWLTQENLQAALTVCAALIAGACFLLTREVRATHGVSAAVTVVLIMYLFSRYDGGLGTTLSENLGLLLGLVSFALLWRGATLQRQGIIWLGLWLLTLAQCARPGCLFVLPALILAGAWGFRETCYLSWRFLLGSSIAVCCGFLTNFLLVKVTAAPGAEAFSNFSQVLYGLVVGGKGWQQIYLDHPGAREGQEMYCLAYQAFLAQPGAVITGALSMLREYFPPHEHHAFSFVRSYSNPFIAQAICYLLAGVGLFICLRRLHTPLYLFLAAAACGHLLSIPFAPPIDSGMRTYAATIPILALLIALAVAEVAAQAKYGKLGGKLHRPVGFNAATQTSASFWGAAEIYGVALAALIILGPLFLRITGNKPRLTETPCQPGQEAVYTRLTVGSSIQLPADAANKMPLKQPELQKEAGRFVAQSRLITAYELKTGDLIWLIAPPELPLTQRGLARFCGNYSVEQSFGKSNVFFANSLQTISP